MNYENVKKCGKGILIIASIIIIFVLFVRFISTIANFTVEAATRSLGTKTETIYPAKVETTVTVLRNGENKKAAEVEFLMNEYTIVIPEDLDVNHNDYINCRVTEYKLLSYSVFDIEYAETQHYHLLSDGMYYAGMNKGVALFTDNQDGAVKFTQIHALGGNVDLVSWVEMLMLNEELVGDCHFVLCE